MFLCAEQPFWKENVYERGIWRAEICNEKVFSLSVFLHTFFVQQSTFFFTKLIYWTICVVLFWTPTLYVFGRPNSYVSSSITQQKKTIDGGTRKRYLFSSSTMLLPNFNRMFINGVYTCLLEEFSWIGRDNDLHRLLFMPNGLPDGAELAYYVKGQVLKYFSVGDWFLLWWMFCWCDSLFLSFTENIRWLQAGEWYCLWMLWQRGMIIELYRPHQVLKFALRACLPVSPSLSLLLNNNITCTCEQISPSQFEAHAGMAARRQPWVAFKVLWFLFELVCCNVISLYVLLQLPPHLYL